MSRANTPEALVAHNQSALGELRRALALRPQRFSLVLAQCNYRRLQTALVNHLTETAAAVEVALPATVQNLREALQAQAVAGKALLVTGLEEAATLDRLWITANQGRDAFPQDFPQPVVLWVTDRVLLSLSRHAPDFKSFAGSPLAFQYPIPALMEALHHQANALFGMMLSLGDDSLEAEAMARYERGSSLRAELTVALAELAQAQQSLNPELQASLDFLRGRDALSQGDLDLARYYFEHSLAYWNAPGQDALGQNAPGQDAPKPIIPIQKTPRHPLPQPSPSLQERQAVLYFYLGVTWRSGAATRLSPQRVAYRQRLERAEQYFVACLQGFRQGQRLDLVGRFLHPLAEVRQKLEDWDGLERVAQEGLTLHRSDAVRLARDQGYLAEVALSRGEWNRAEEAVTTALQILKIAEAVNQPVVPPPLDSLVLPDAEVSTNPGVAMDAGASANPGVSPKTPSFPEPQSPRFPKAGRGLAVAHQYQRGWYYYLLARVQMARSHSAAAISWLEQARHATRPQWDLTLYRQILTALHQQHFQQGDYRQAFAIKQQQRQIDTQFKLRAFLGAGPIQASEALSPSPRPTALVDPSRPIAPEIQASGRQTDVDALVERLVQPRYPLVILHGPSGVGKSSILYGGLVPALAKVFPEGRTILPVVIKTYRPWPLAVGQALALALESLMPSLTPEAAPCPIQPQAILHELRALPQQRHLQLVLIFDQVEEFFAEVASLERRREFYQFLVDCFNTAYIKVVLALREDALHYLLELERGFKLDVLNYDILSRDYRYYLGNLQPDAAKALIRQLSQGAYFYLEEALIDHLVADLTVEGEVSPIELQVVGAQLQRDDIDRLAAYRQLGPQPKETLVQRFLAVVVNDCGPENALLARGILYLLTDIDRDQRPYRPAKSQDDLENDLHLRGTLYSLGQLTLVLEVLVGSGLVFLIPAAPSPRYQLVHDYLVTYVRQDSLPAILGWRS